MPTRTLALAVALSLPLALSACKKEEDKKDDKKEAKDSKDAKKDGKDAKKDGKDAKDDKADGGDEGSLHVAEGDDAVDGPVPPDTSAVLFAIEGALYPLACFDKDKKKLSHGEDCMKMVGKDADVRIASKFSSFAKKAGEPTEPQCMAGTGKKLAIAVDGITQGADFVYGAWPPAVIKIVALAGDDTTSPPKTVLDQGPKDSLAAAIKDAGASGEITVDQVAEVDLDGDGKAEKVVTAHIPNPQIDETYDFAGLFVARGGDFGKLELVEKLKNKPDAFELRGTFDLDGDKSAELWVRRTSQDGSAGDSVFTGPGGKWKQVGGWSCGVE